MTKDHQYDLVSKLKPGWIIGTFMVPGWIERNFIKPVKEKK